MSSDPVFQIFPRKVKIYYCETLIVVNTSLENIEQCGLFFPCDLIVVIPLFLKKKPPTTEKSKTRESPISIYPLRLAAHAILLLVEGLLPYFLLLYSERRKCLWKAFLETGAAMGTFHNAENFLSIEDHHCR